MSRIADIQGILQELLYTGRERRLAVFHFLYIMAMYPVPPEIR